MDISNEAFREKRHDFRNQLSPILASMEMIQHRTKNLPHGNLLKAWRELNDDDLSSERREYLVKYIGLVIETYSEHFEETIAALSESKSRIRGLSNFVDQLGSVDSDSLEPERHLEANKDNSGSQTGSSSDGVLGGQRVLVADDNPINLNMMRALLGANQLLVETAESGEAAIESVRANPPDLILMDLNMPGTSGVEATRAIRKLEGGAQIPIVALSAFSLDEQRESAGDCGFNAHLSKPLNIDALKRLLEKLLLAASPVVD